MVSEGGSRKSRVGAQTVGQRLSNQEFQVGLAMAGAISAGAYTAGVFDFLIQALDCWEKARNEPGGEALPNHRVGIKVVAGASAGAITGALGVVALAQGVRPTRISAFDGQQINCMLPSLYTAWVVKPTLVSDIGAPDFLQTDDLASGTVASLLDCAVLDDIRAGALKAAGPQPEQMPYVAKQLHVYMTVTNLRGVPYSIAFEGGNYGMMTHGDRAHYLIGGLGAWDSGGSKFADPDKPIPLATAQLFAPGGASEDWEIFAKTAIASAAVPTGLAPRELTMALPTYSQRLWPLPELELQSNISPNWPKPWGQNPDRDFVFMSVDGGVVNNDAFDYAHFSLMEDPPKPNIRSGDDADRAVVMISPFPEPPTFLPDGQPDNQIINVLKALLPGFITQARFKPGEMLLAASESVFSRYMIAPHRVPPGKTIEETYAIACGLLSGFGGFLAREFREHDFMLGQRNCQKFLQSSFALPVYHKIIQQWPEAAKTNPNFAVPPQDGQPPFMCLIPLVGDAAREIPYPQWPRMSQAALDDVNERIAARLDLVADALVTGNAPGFFIRQLVSFIFKLKRSAILDFIKYTILSDLVRRDQIQGWDLPTTWKRPAPTKIDPVAIRKVLAELLNPSFDLRNEGGLAAATQLDPGDVRAVLAMCQAETGAPYEVWQSATRDKSGGALYSLASRKPSLLRNIPGVRNVGQWASPLRTDPPGI